jgi:hypothetical protein
MFFLSPLLWISRMFHPRLKDLTQDQLRDLLQRTHRVPSAPVNGLLTCCFSAETPLGLRMPFPWGTSILGVFRKKA